MLIDITRNNRNILLFRTYGFMRFRLRVMNKFDLSFRQCSGSWFYVYNLFQIIINWGLGIIFVSIYPFNYECKFMFGYMYIIHNNRFKFQNELLKENL